MAANSSDVIPFDLTAQDRIIRGRMPTLEIIHDRFTRLFRLTISNALRRVVDISVRSTELLKFGDFLERQTIPSSLNLFRMNPLEGNAVMVLDTRLVFQLIDLFFGGSGELEVKAEGRDFTEIEQRVVKRVVMSALEDLQIAWEPIFPVQTHYQRNEVNPNFLSIVPYSEIVVAVTFELELGLVPTTITLCIPYSMIEPISNRLNARIVSESPDNKDYSLKRKKEILKKTPLEVRSVLGEVPTSLETLKDLKEGSILMTQQRADKPMDIFLNGLLQYKAKREGSSGLLTIEQTLYDNEDDPWKALAQTELECRVELGRTALPLQEVAQLQVGSVIPFTKLVGEPMEVRVGEEVLAKAEVVVVNDSYAARITGFDTPDNWGDVMEEELLQSLEEEKSESPVEPPAPPPPKSEEPEPSPAPPAPTLKTLESIAPEITALYVEHEHPQTIALIMAHLTNTEQASTVLSHLPENLQADVSYRIAALKRVPPGIIAELDDVLAEEMKNVSNWGPKVGGVETVSEMLHSVDKATQTRILNIIEKEDSNLGKEIREALKKLGK